MKRRRECDWALNFRHVQVACRSGGGFSAPAPSGGLRILDEHPLEATPTAYRDEVRGSTDRQVMGGPNLPGDRTVAGRQVASIVSARPRLVSPEPQIL